MWTIRMEINPYQSPNAELKPAAAGNDNRGKNSSPVKYVVAALGALLVFLGASLVLLLIPVVIAPQIYQRPMGVIILYIVAIPLAIFAAIQSFRATLRIYRRKLHSYWRAKKGTVLSPVQHATVTSLRPRVDVAAKRISIS